MTSRRVLTLLTTALTLAACGSGSGLGGSSGGGGGGSTSLRREVGLAVAEEVEAALAALSILNLGTPTGFTFAAGCPTTNNVVDTDGDGIPNDQIQTYNAPPCTSDVDGGLTMAVTGDVEVKDASSGNTGSFTVDLTDLEWTFADASPATVLQSTRDGDRTRTGDLNGATELFNVFTSHLRPQRATATIHTTATLAFTAIPVGSMTATGELPSGSANVSGTLTWVRSSENLDFVISTASSLVYDANCVSNTQRLTAGEVDLDGIISGLTGTLKIKFTACGQDPTVTFEEAP